MDAPQSIWLRFLPELAEIVMEYLDEIDTCGYLGMVCRHWTMKATERTYRRLCHRVYLQQTQKKSLNVNQWGGLWRNMLVNRPRLRTNGEYWLRTTTWKRPENDRFWEDNSAEYIEVGKSRNGRRGYYFVLIAHSFSIRLYSSGIFDSLTTDECCTY